jgi:hypothetical protein
MDGPWLPDPANPDQQRQTFLFAFLDDYSRLILHAQFYWNEQLPRLEDCFKRAIPSTGSGQASATVAPWPSMWTKAKSTLPNSSIPFAPPWASSVSWAHPTTPKAEARSNASSSSSSLTSCPSSSGPPSPPSLNSTSPSWPGSRSSTIANSTPKPPRLPSNAIARTQPPPHGRQTPPNSATPSSIATGVR